MADSKISELTALTTPASDDVLAIVDTSAGVTKKITISNLSTSSEVVDDTTPQLGGDLDLNSNDITGTGNIDVTGTVTADAGSWTAIVSGNAITFDRNGENNIVADNGSSANLNLTAGNRIFYSADDYHSFKTGSSPTEKLRILANGKVGIGTTSPATALDVTGTVTADGLSLGDNEFLLAGGTDLKIGSDGTTSILRSQGVPLVIDANGITFRGYSPYTTHMDIATNGDISFYEDTGTTAKFFWDASAESLGIGTSSPASGLHVLLGSADVFRLERDSTNDWRFQLTAGALAFRDATNDAERLRIDSDGNVGIGTTSPSNKLHVHGGDASVYSIFAKSDTKWMYLHSGATDPAIGWDTGGSIRFGTATSNVGAGFSEKMRIDSSGNLLVGKTSAGLGTTGVEASSGGYIRATRDGNSLTLNRISTDGNLATFTKDGTTVGSIGVIHGNNLFIGAPSHSGLQFGTTIIYPTGGSTGDANDATVDIGASGQRFKDLYLSGTATMDGLTVDDITINGSTISDAGNFTIDAGGDIALDAGGSDIQFLASGTEFGRVFGSSDNFYIQARQSDKDMIFQGIDGGSAITALTLDMSDAGKATFNHDVFVGGNLNVIGVDVNITANVNHSGDGDTFFGFHGDDLWRVATGGVERLEASNSGIIINDSGVDADFRVESNGNANMLFVDGGNNAVGIGTSSPESLLHVKAGDAVTGVIKIKGGKNTVTSVGEINSQLDFGSNDISVNNTGNIGGRIASVTEHENGALTGMAFYTFTQDASPDLSEKVRITNTGNVGIGTTSPSYKLSVSGNIGLTDGVSTATHALVGGNYYMQNTGAYSTIFQTAGTERMRIDASGNVLVGKTSSDLGATAGIELNGQYDVGYFTRSAEKALVVNRLSTDGTIVEFRKNGTAVGSIGVIHGNNLFIGAPSHSGLQFGTTIIYPTGGSIGDANDATIDIGASGQRFKDFYLSGNASVGSISTPTAGTSNFVAGVNAGNSIESGGNYNTVVGDEAGTAITTGDNNVAVGYNAGAAVTTAVQNVLIGYSAGDALNTGSINVAIGNNALSADTKGARSVAIGYEALQNQNFTSDTSVYNTAVGGQAGQQITTGIQNTLIGGLAGDALTDSDYNVAIGYQALSGDTLGSRSIAIGRRALATQNFTSATNSYNVAIGYGAGEEITTGESNTLIGGLAGDATTTGSNNVAVGKDSLTANTEGANNVSLGAFSLDANTTASNNTAVGYASLGANTTGDENVSVGKDSLKDNSTGSGNVAVGVESLANNTTATGNVAVGKLSMFTNTIGTSNTALGYQALRLNTTADNNTAVGYHALVANTTGTANVAIGAFSLDANTTADSNTAVGYNAGTAITTGYSNTFVGESAGNGTDDGALNVAVGASALSANCANSNTAVGVTALVVTTGANNTALGYQAGASVTSGSNNLLVGRDAGLTGSPGGNITTGSNEIVLGDENITEAHIQVDWTVASDERDKTDFTALDLGLDFVKNLQPVTYKWDKRSKYGDKSADGYDLNAQTPDGTHKEDWLDIGFKAQEVEALEIAAGYTKDNKTNLVSSHTGDGKQMGLQYSKFVPILVKAIQELSAQNAELTTRITALEG